MPGMRFTAVWVTAAAPATALCVKTQSSVVHQKEMPGAQWPPALASTIVLAKVIPSPASLDLHNSSLSAFYSFSPRAGCPVAMCVLQSLASLT